MKFCKSFSAIILTITSLYTACAFAVCANPTVADCPETSCDAAFADKECPPKCPETKLAAYPHCSRFAILPGFYLGGQIGYSELYYKEESFSPTTNAVTVNNTGTGGRAYLGYQINPYWGAEAGYTRFAKSSIQHLTTGSLVNASGDILQTSYDLVAKATYPLIDSGFNAYVKAGGALTSVNVPSNLCSVGEVCSQTQLLFTYGAGATYNLTRHVPIEFAWTRVQHNDTISTADLFSVGLGYYFG